MSVNYKKLKSQLKQETMNGKSGWLFSVTEEQEKKMCMLSSLRVKVREGRWMY